MSIKRVSCPGCNQSLNVPASMASTKCPSCGTVFSPSNPAAAAPAPAAKKLPESDTPRDPTQLLPWLVAGGVAALAVIGLIGLTFLGGESSSNDSPAAGSSEQTVAEESPLPIPSEYRVVDLPETTRMSIYRDYKQMMASSFGKAKKVPKSGAAGQALRGMLQSTVEREVTHMALIHGVSEDDILQIVAEGEAKGW